MIQRIQTLYLLTAAIASGACIFVFNLWTNAAKKEVFAFDLFAEASILQKGVPVLFLTATLSLISSIFLFKNRKLQFVWVRIVILIQLFLLGILIYLSLTLSGETAVSLKGIGMFLPVIVILLCVLANKAIRKDENLVKSVDRLR